MKVYILIDINEAGIHSVMKVFNNFEVAKKYANEKFLQTLTIEEKKELHLYYDESKLNGDNYDILEREVTE